MVSLLTPGGGVVRTSALPDYPQTSANADRERVNGVLPGRDANINREIIQRYDDQAEIDQAEIDQAEIDRAVGAGRQGYGLVSIWWD
jgi:hypothetical protein